MVDGVGGTYGGELVCRGAGRGEVTVCRGVDAGVTEGRGEEGEGKQGDSDAGGAIVLVCVRACVWARVLHNGLTHTFRHT